MARPTKLTTEIQKLIIDLIRVGNYAEVAAGAAGIGESTYYRWIARGKEDLEGIYAEFWEAVEVASQNAEADALRRVLQASNTDWRAAAWYLERRNPSRWGRREHHQIEGGGSALALQIILAKDADEDDDGDNAT